MQNIEEKKRRTDRSKERIERMEFSIMYRRAVLSELLEWLRNSSSYKTLKCTTSIKLTIPPSLHCLCRQRVPS